MASSYYFYAFITFLAAFVSLALTLRAWRIRTSYWVKLSFVIFMGSVTIWVFGYGMEITARVLESKLFWANLKYIGVVFVPLSFLVFALYFTQHEKITGLWVQTLLTVYAAVNLGIVWTDQGHDLFRQNLVLQQEPFPILRFSYGPFFYTQIVINSLILLGGSILIIIHLYKARKVYKNQLFFLFPAVLLPWVSIILEMSGLNLTPYFSTTVFAFVISGFFYVLANPDDQSFIFNNLKVGIVFLNLNQHIVDFNRKAREYLFGDIKNLTGQSILNYVPEIAGKNLKTDEDFVLEIKREIGTEILFFELQISKVRYWDDPFLNGHLIIIHDISDQKLAEKAFLFSQSELKALFESQLVAIATLDTHGNYIQINDRWAEMSGYSHKEVEGQSYLKFTHPEDRVNCQRKFSELLDWKLVSRQVERRILRKDGNIFWAYLSISPIQDTEGKTIAFSEVMVDVTEYVNIQQALRESEEKYRGVSERANDGIVIIQNFILEYVNPRMAVILGYDQEALIGKSFSELVAPREAENLVEQHKKRMEGGAAPLRYETELLHKDGHIIPVEINAGLMEYKGHQADLVIIRDITQRKENERELAEKNQALERSIKQANQLRSLAERRATEMETLREAGGVVNTVLNKEEMVSLILEQLARVVPYDSASVQLLHGECLELVGYRGFNQAEEIIGLRFPVDVSNPGWEVIKSQKPLIIENVFDNYLSFQSSRNKSILGWLGVPLLIQDQVIGLLSLDSQKAGHFNQEHSRLAAAFANQVAIALENARLFEEVRRLAVTDPLTGLYNRRHYYSMTNRELERNRRYQVPFSILMMDVDHFKDVNDTYGHLSGDQVLRVIADLIGNNLREVDVPCRYGGEEFVVTLPETSLENAEKLAERLRYLIENTKIETDNGQVRVTVSIGVAQFDGNCRDIDHLLNCADIAMYQAKDKGRNKVVSYK